MTQREHDAESAPRPVVSRLLAGLVAQVCRVPWLVLALTGLSLAACLYLAGTRLQYRAQRDQMIHPDKECQRLWRRFTAEFGNDEDMVVVVQGSPAQRTQMIAAVEAVAQRVQAHPDQFDRLFYKVDLRPLANRALLYLSSQEIAQIQNNLEQMRPLLDRPALAWRLISLASLVNEGKERLRRLIPGEPLGPADAQFFRQLLVVCQSARLALAQPGQYQNPWPKLAPGGSARDAREERLHEPQYFFSEDGMLAFLLVRPAGQRDTFLGPRASADHLRAILADMRAPFPDLRLGLTGLPVLETDEMVASQNDSNFASWLALAGVSLLYLLVFRHPRLPFLTVSTLIVGTVWALGWLTLTVGHLNLLSATFAVMLIGMGDYGVLWVTRYQQERAAGLEVLEASEATAAGVGPGILTAAITTGTAFYAAMFSDFMAVAELGWVAGSGVLLCALACFTVLPALIVVLPRRAQESRVHLRLPESRPTYWLPGLASRPRWVLAGGLALLILLGGWAFRTQYDHNLLNLQSSELDSVRWERRLVAHTAGASWHALSHTVSHEEALRLRTRFEAIPAVSHVVEVASLIPTDQESKREQLQQIQARLRRLPTRGAAIQPLLSSPASLRQQIEDLVGSDPWQHDHPTSGGVLRPLLDVADGADPLLLALEEECSGLRTALAGVPVDQLPAQLKAFEGRLVTDLAESLHRLRDVATPEPIALSDLPPSLRERYVSPSGRWLLRVFGKGDLWEYDQLAGFVTAVRTVDPEATGKPFTTLEGLRSMRLGFLWAGAYALLAIVVVLSLDFRSFGRVLLALAPLAVGLTLALGVMGLVGFPLNPANMIALPLVLGVGVDNGVHVLHDFLARRRKAGEPYRLGLATGKGILVAALTTMLGFGTLMLSSHRGLFGLGFILTLGVGCCMLTSLVLLPALLSVLDRPQTSAAEQTASRQAA